MTPGYDPKQKRAHSPAAAEHAPVDDLLGAPAEPPDAPRVGPAPAPTPRPAARPLAPKPPPANPGPDPRLLAAVAVAVTAFLVWRGRRSRRA